MAFDDPIVWVLIIAVVVFLFGANKIPQFAKAIGQARREFDQASKELTNPSSPTVPYMAPQTIIAEGSALVQPPITSTSFASPAASQSDPLFLAAQKEGIDTTGKTEEQVATELAWKLSQQAAK